MPTSVYAARALLGYGLAPGLSIFAGPTYSVLGSSPGAHSGAPGYATHLADGSSAVYRPWPGLAVGVEGL